MRIIFTSLIFTLLAFCQNAAFGQTSNTDTSAAQSIQPTKQISLLTCGTGDELYSSFGHTAIRIKELHTHKDIVYNYGTFNFRDSLFYVKFTLGKLNYYLAKDYYEDFLYGYRMEGRSVKEQVLDLSNEEIDRLYNFLEYNALPQNREYKYDFVHDNCATRVRDAFENALGPSLVMGNVVGEKKVSFRNVINEYLAQNHWSRLGINILLGSNVDSLMTSRSAMFIPFFLERSLGSAQLASKPVVSKTQTILEAKPQATNFNIPLIIGCLILFLAVLVYNVKSLEKFRNTLSRIFLFIFGLLGFLILFMWLGTEHQACNNNYNILWAVPTHLIVSFLAFKGKPWARLYAMFAISLLIVAILVHILGLQVMPLIELIPWFMILMLVYIDLYKQSMIGRTIERK